MFELKYNEVNLWSCLGQFAKDNSLLLEFSEWWTRFNWPRALPIAFGEITRLRVILVIGHRHWHSGVSGFGKLGKEIFLKCDLFFGFKLLKLFKLKAIITTSTITANRNDFAANRNDSDFVLLILIEIIKIILIWASGSSAGSGSGNWWWSMFNFAQANNRTTGANNNIFFLLNLRMKVKLMLMLMTSSFFSRYLSFHGTHNKLSTEFVYFWRHNRHLGDLQLALRVRIMNET